MTPEGLAYWNYSCDSLGPLTNAIWNGVADSETGRGGVAKTPELFQYDQGCNLTNDGRFAYGRDGENWMKC